MTESLDRAGDLSVDAYWVKEGWGGERSILKAMEMLKVIYTNKQYNHILAKDVLSKIFSFLHSGCLQHSVNHYPKVQCDKLHAYIGSLE